MRRFGTTLCVMAFVLTSPALAGGPQIYWLQSTFSTPMIRMCDSAGHGLTTTPLAAGSLPHGLALHVKSSSLFWASDAYVRPHIFRTALTSSSSTALPNDGLGSFFQGVALDTIAGKVYWTSSHVALGCTIRRANLDGSGAEGLIAFPPTGVQNLRGIALDLQHQVMYWADFGAGMIRSATLDGASPKDILTGLAGPMGIALDIPGGKMYWCETNGHALKRANLDGSSPATIVSGLAAPHYLAIDSHSKLLYWTELGGNGHGWIKRATLEGANVVTLLGDHAADSVQYPAGIAVLESNTTTDVQVSTPPAEFVLSQNYPNPFNPTTTITYQLPMPVHVSLSVYDVLGRPVALLVDENKGAGVYDVRFDARGLASGVYIYRLQAGTFTQARGLVIAK